MIPVEHITNSQIKSKTYASVKLCDYSDAYMHVKGTITVSNMAAVSVAASDNTGKKVLFKTFASVADCISEIIPK